MNITPPTRKQRNDEHSRMLPQKLILHLNIQT